MFQQTLFAKKSRISKTVFFADFDGTLFSPDGRLITAPFYNIQLKRLFQKSTIPFVVVTGRSHWTFKSEVEIFLLGLPQPDAVITGAGSIIYYRMPNGQLALDTSWEKHMQQTIIHLPQSKKTLWNRERILKTLPNILPPDITILPQSSATYLIRLYGKNIPLKKLSEFKKTIENYFTEGIQVIFTEKLLQQNSLAVFSGNILLVPTTAGKENAVKYILNLLPYYKEVRCFGDATIDVPMLTIKSESKKFDMQTYGVNLTPLAKKLLQDQAPSNPQLHIIDSPHSPKAILEITKKLRAKSSSHLLSKDGKKGFSAAQNTPARLILQPFESFLDTFFDQSLSPNEISFKGLEMVKQSIDLFYDKKIRNPLTKLTIWRLYTVGNLTDILDGIRARQTNTISNQGQLIDVFCDRAKEFYQLYQRGLKRLNVIPAKAGISQYSEGYQTLLTAISCILPSIARAQAELSGIIVKELDAQGGSMLARTRRLFFSFFFETLGLNQESLAIDQKIYTTNIATYQNRLSSIENKTNFLSLGERIKVRGKTQLQQKAQERFLLLIQLLQEENELVEKVLKPYPGLMKKYEKEFKKHIEKYLKLHVSEERKKFKITSYKNLNLSTYLTQG